MKKLIEKLYLSEQFKYFKNNIFNILIKHYIITISLISYFLLIVYSPIFSVIWLCLPSLYFLYKLNYKDFFSIWGITLFIWHSIFTFIFLDFGPTIMIGGDYTKKLLDYLLLNDGNLWFTGLCYQTVFIFDFFSQETGFLICIPVLFPLKKTYCMPNNNNTPERKKGWFGGEIVEPAKEDKSKNFK